MAQPVTCWILLLVGACVTEHGPQLTSADPASASGGALVTLSGARLCDGDCDTAAGEVLIGLGSTQLRAQVASYDDDLVVIAVPVMVPIGETQIVVSVRDQSSNALDFVVTSQ